MAGLPDDKTPSGPISKQAAYNKTSSYFMEAMDKVVQVMRTSKNDNAVLGACNTIIDKVLPDIKANELTEDGARTLDGLIRIFTGGHIPEQLASSGSNGQS